MNLNLSCSKAMHIKRPARLVNCTAKSVSGHLVVHANRFAKYTGKTERSQPASGSPVPSNLKLEPASKSGSKASSQTTPQSQSTTPPPLRFAKYTAGATTSGHSGSTVEATVKSSNKVQSKGKAPTQSASPPSLRFSQHTTGLTDPGPSSSKGDATTNSAGTAPSTNPPPLRFAQYTAKAASPGPTGANSAATSQSAHKGPARSQAPSQSTTPPTLRFAKYTAKSSNPGASGPKLKATSNSASKSPSQSTSPPPLRFAKYTAGAATSGQLASSSTGSETSATSSSAPAPSSTAKSVFDHKQAQGHVYHPSRETSTEVNGTNAEQAVDDTTDAVHGNGDEPAGAAQEGLSQHAKGIPGATDQTLGGGIQLEQDAQDVQEVVDSVEEARDNAADKAAEQLSNAADQVQSVAQAAPDAAVDRAEYPSDKPTLRMNAVDSQYETVQHRIRSLADAIVSIKQKLASTEQAENGARVDSGSESDSESESLHEECQKGNHLNGREHSLLHSQAPGSGAPQVSHYSSDSSEAGQGGTNEVAQQRLLGSPGLTLERVVEELRAHLRQERVPEDQPAEAGPAKYPYTNNTVADFVDIAEDRADEVAAFTVAAEYKNSIDFQLILGGSGTGKTRMGTEIRRFVAQQAADCTDKQKPLWQTAQAVSLDFSASGDPITHTDNATPPTCMLGLRVAARNLFHCSLPDMQQHLPVHLRQLFTLQGVTRLLARQKRESLGLSTDAVILQVITVDDMQLLSQQSKALQMSSGVLANEMVTELAGWMIAGGAEKCAGLCVLIGTGLQSASMGMAGYATKPMQISRLTAPQVSRLMTSALVSANDGLTSQQADDILGHDSMRVQLKLLMGLPGFMDTGLQVLCTKLKNGSVPQNDLDIRQLAGEISEGVRDKLRDRLQEEFRALGADVVFRLLLLSFSGVTVDKQCTFISAGMTLEDASTSSGVVWTMPCGDGVQAVMPPVVQYQAARHCLLQGQQPQWTPLLSAMQESLPFPFNTIAAGLPLERLVAISIASRMHLFSAGVTSALVRDGTCTWSQLFPTAAMNSVLGASAFKVRALDLAQDSHQLLRSTQGEVDLIVESETHLETADEQEPGLAWDDPNYLVFMDSVHGPASPFGDLRFVVETVTGRLQLVVVQCKKVGAGTKKGRDRAASPKDIEQHLTQLRACVDRWNKKGNSAPLELVYVWLTTAPASTKLLTYASQQKDLIVVHREALPRLCPVLGLAPELYTEKQLSVAPISSGAQRSRAKRPSPKQQQQPTPALQKADAQA